MFQPHVVPEVPNEDSPAETSGLVLRHKQPDCRAILRGGSCNRTEHLRGCERFDNDMCALPLFQASPESRSMGFRDRISLPTKRVSCKGEPRIVPCLSGLLLSTLLATVPKPCAQKRRCASGVSQADRELMAVGVNRLFPLYSLRVKRVLRQSPRLRCGIASQTEGDASVDCGTPLGLRVDGKVPLH